MEVFPVTRIHSANPRPPPMCGSTNELTCAISSSVSPARPPPAPLKVKLVQSRIPTTRPSRRIPMPQTALQIWMLDSPCGLSILQDRCVPPAEPLLTPC
eukprot:1195554-Prorocentrum_minimum.AAC.2